MSGGGGEGMPQQYYESSQDKLCECVLDSDSFYYSWLKRCTHIGLAVVGCFSLALNGNGLFKEAITVDCEKVKRKLLALSKNALSKINVDSVCEWMNGLLYTEYLDKKQGKVKLCTGGNQGSRWNRVYPGAVKHERFLGIRKVWERCNVRTWATSECIMNNEYMCINSIWVIK